MEEGGWKGLERTGRIRKEQMGTTSTRNNKPERLSLHALRGFHSLRNVFPTCNFFLPDNTDDFSDLTTTSCSYGLNQTYFATSFLHDTDDKPRQPLTTNLNGRHLYLHLRPSSQEPENLLPGTGLSHTSQNVTMQLASASTDKLSALA